MVMEESKTEVLPINKHIGVINAPHGNINPKDTIIFLGFHLQKNLKIRQQVTITVAKINRSTGRIWQFPNLPQKCEVMLYFALVQSHLMTNAACVLPFLTAEQSLKIQRACNNAIRAIITLRWRKTDSKPKSITKIRQKLGIPSVAELTQRVVAFEAWKDRENLNFTSTGTQTTYKTRNSHLLKIPDEIGPKKWSLRPKIVKSWNELPPEIKICSDHKKAKNLIKKLYTPATPRNPVLVRII